MAEKVVVTGAAGFIGSHVVDALLARGDVVVGIDNFDTFYDPDLKRANLADAMLHPSFELVEADVRDAAAMRRVVDAFHPDAIVHLAARAGVRPSIQDPALYAAVNVLGTTVLLEAARAAKISRIIVASSSSVYGNDATPPFREDESAIRPISPYAATKRAAELMCETYAGLCDWMQIISLRFFTVYGPRQRPDLAIRSFTRKIVGGRVRAVLRRRYGRARLHVHHGHGAGSARRRRSQPHVEAGTRDLQSRRVGRDVAVRARDAHRAGARHDRQARAAPGATRRRRRTLADIFRRRASISATLRRCRSATAFHGS